MDLSGQGSRGSQKNITWAILVILPIVAFFVSLFWGRYHIPIGELAKILAAKIFPLAPTWSPTMETVACQVRLPRIMAAMLIGASLATSGAAYQGILKNPLVSPDILGASAGAGLGAAVGIYFSLGTAGIQVCSFTFGLLAVSLTYFLARLYYQDPALVLVLAGVLVGTLFTAGTSLLKYLADPYDKLPAITFWLMGSLAAATTRDVLIILPLTMAGAMPLYLARWRLNILSLSEEEALALGLDPKKWRAVVISCATLMTSASVSVGGIIGWVGLIVPHLARMVVGPNYRELLPASVFIGSTYLLLVDDLARNLAPVEVPLGILSSFIGAPFFLYLLQHVRRGWV